ncbi:chryseobasin-related MNIO class RiPP peptide [Hymenobacter oligotrophus]|nr:hypothetical protein [Hymenobacter oligotrophus]
MKLPKAVLGAVLIGLTVQTTTSCVKDDVKPKEEKGSTKTPVNCPACGMG